MRIPQLHATFAFRVLKRMEHYIEEEIIDICFKNIK